MSLNLLTDVPGLKVGNAQDARARTGATVILPDKPAVAAAAISGGAPGTRETDLLDPACLVERVDALVLAGGSAFGLAAADSVAAWLAKRRRGFRVGAHAVPIVPAAILFDLNNGGRKPEDPGALYRRLGAKACTAAARRFALGTAGAGYGAQAGALKGGLGSASHVAADGLAVGALAAVNAFGSVLIPGTPHFWAAALERDDEFGGRGLPLEAPKFDAEPTRDKPGLAGGNTTLAVVATNATLTKAEAQRVAIMARDGLARAIRPSHAPFDGDSVFVLATGERPPARNRAWEVTRIGTFAADGLARAVARGVYEATAVGAMLGYRDLYRPVQGRGR
jgi:L-aminopeptidase/D-esterase-like protein